jgi:acetoin utilization protein AcuB
MLQSVGRVMSNNIITAKADETLSEAHAKFKKYNIRHLPVVDVNGDIIGVLSDRDFQRALPKNVKECDGKINETLQFEKTARIANYMSWPVKTVPRTTYLADACEIMIREKISALIVSDGDAIAGIVTQEDLLRVLSETLAAQQGTFDSKIKQWVYNSPIGELVNFLSEIGI